MTFRTAADASRWAEEQKLQREFVRALGDGLPKVLEACTDSLTLAIYRIAEHLETQNDLLREIRDALKDDDR